MKKSVNVLGTKYSVLLKRYEDDEAFSRNKWVGYCDENTKEIVVCKLLSHPGWNGDCTPKSAEVSEKQTLRHEIVHAFLDESGLSYSALQYGSAWAKNEEMIDWFAIQGPKVYAAWQEAGAL